jgi:hypothetical protein
VFLALPDASLAVHEDSIAINDAFIAVNGTSIAINEVFIAVPEDSIAVNGVSIAINGSSIAVLESSIAINEVSIAVNGSVTVGNYCRFFPGTMALTAFSRLPRGFFNTKTPRHQATKSVRHYTEDAEAQRTTEDQRQENTGGNPHTEYFKISLSVHQRMTMFVPVERMATRTARNLD